MCSPACGSFGSCKTHSVSAWQLDPFVGHLGHHFKLHNKDIFFCLDAGQFSWGAGLVGHVGHLGH